MADPVPAAGPAWNTLTRPWPDLGNPRADANTLQFNTQLASLRTGAAAGTPMWIRSYPALVRVDVTTRTVRKRSEYTPAAGTADYLYQTRTLIITPKHFGLFY
jgi:hypothetical protein